MANGLKPIRRVVTGNDARGQSKVTWDGPAPNAHEASLGAGRGHTDLWVWHDSPPLLSGEDDDGNLAYDFPGPPNGGHLRVVQARGCPQNYNFTDDPGLVPVHEPEASPSERMWDRGGNNA